MSPDVHRKYLLTPGVVWVCMCLAENGELCTCYNKLCHWNVIPHFSSIFSVQYSYASTPETIVIALCRRKVCFQSVKNTLTYNEVKNSFDVFAAVFFHSFKTCSVNMATERVLPLHNSIRHSKDAHSLSELSYRSCMEPHSSSIDHAFALTMLLSGSQKIKNKWTNKQKQNQKTKQTMGTIKALYKTFHMKRIRKHFIELQPNSAPSESFYPIVTLRCQYT